MNYWIKPALDMKPPFIAVYRINFVVNKTIEMKFEFSADERCELFLDGQRIADGPERGDVKYWYLQNYGGTLLPGKHTLTARVLCFGQKLTAYAQMSIKHGFYLKADEPLSGILDTESGNWEAQQVTGISFLAPYPDWGTFPRFELDGTQYNWNILHGTDGLWRPVERFPDQRELHVPDLPLMSFESEKKFKVVYASDKTNQDAALSSSNLNLPDVLQFPAGSSRRIIIAFDEYVCAWTNIFFFGGTGATVQMRWAETLYDEGPDAFDRLNLKGPKGDRSAFHNKYFIGDASIITLPGGLKNWSDYWWKAGRYFELVIENPNQNLEIKLDFHRTGYPFSKDYSAKSSSFELNNILSIAVHTLQACSHETFIDCPYYEQLQYIGDTRLETLCTYTISNDARLPLKALKTLLRPQKSNGMIFSQYPSKGEQVIPSFSLIYIFMLHDFAMWRNYPELVEKFLTQAEKIVDYLVSHLKDDNLLYLPGWNFIDWVDSWKNGVPQGSEVGTNCILNWMAIIALKKMTELENNFGDGKQGAQYTLQAQAIERAIFKNYFNSERGLFSDDFDLKYYSEHSQVMALLSQSQPQEIKTQLICGLRNAEILEPSSIYFSHYYLEACYQESLEDLFFARLEKWYALEQFGMKTFPENFENPRSDCHAWSSHPLYHYYASILGVRPSLPGFAEIQFRPMAGPLKYASGIMPHPKGSIKVDIYHDKNELFGKCCSPEEIQVKANYISQSFNENMMFEFNYVKEKNENEF